jgi:hypothetical protein
MLICFSHKYKVKAERVRVFRRLALLNKKVGEEPTSYKTSVLQTL